MNALPHFHRSLVLEAPPARVYATLSTQPGLAAWLTPTCEVDTHVGGHALFRYGPHHKLMRIDALLPEREVRWRCIDALIAFDWLSKKDEWIGTEIVFRLTPEPGGRSTRLDVDHIGLTSGMECHALCSDGWNNYLASLQNLVETGRGMPFDAASAHADNPHGRTPASA